MKKHLTVQWACAMSLVAGLAWGGSVTATGQTWLQTSLATNVAEEVSVVLTGWADQKIAVSAAVTNGADIFTASVTPADEQDATQDRTLELTPRGKSGTAIVILSASTGGVVLATSDPISFTVTPVPVINGLPASTTFKEDTTTNIAFTVEYWGEPSALTTWSATVTGTSGLLSAPAITGSGLSRALSLSPVANKYGSTTVRVTVSDGSRSDTHDVAVKVRPIADAPAVGDWPSVPITLDVGGAPATNILAGVTVTDADHLAYINGTSNEYLKASAAVNAANIYFSPGNGSSSSNLNTGLTPSNVTTWVRGLSLYPPDSTFLPVGQTITNTLTLRVYGFGSNDSLSVTNTVSVLLRNPNHPPQYTPAVSPSSMQEGQMIAPFSISQVFDADVIHTAFSLSLFLSPADGALATLSSAGLMHGNASELNTQLQNVGITAASGVMSTLSTNVTVYYVLSDSIDYVTNAVLLTINQIRTAPVINGIDEVTSFYSINDTETLVPFPTVLPYDTDQGGQQWLSASVAVSAPSLGTCLESAFPLQSQVDLQAALRDLVFEPVAGALSIGDSAEVTLTLTVTDATGLSAVNSSTRVLITAVNKPPRVNVPQMQPVLLPPGGVLLPFVGTTVTNDDLNAVTLTVTLDDNNKGTLGNLGGFTYADGEYTMSGAIGTINASLTNLTYAVNPLYVFPADDPGGTVFTLEAEDYQVKLGSAQVWVQVQEGPRNHLVTQVANDGSPGSLLFALAHVSNNDVITFALPEYPAVIRVPEAFGPLVLSTSLTLKGPGADLLTISGDGDGDGDADGQLFVVDSRVTIEGVTLSQGHAIFGGAVSVGATGSLTLRACALVDCEAEEYGGAIDVEGALLLEGCYLARNRVTGTGFGGGAVSFYTSENSSIVNTTFASNRVENSGGYGGGAVYVEYADAPINVSVTHCTFAGNADASGRASAVYVVGGNTYATVKNNVFSDYSAQDGARNIDVTGDGWVVSDGGNVCDDSTRTAYQQGGGTTVFLLTHATDLTAVAPGLDGLAVTKGDTTPYFPLQSASPALRRAQSSDVTTDQRGRIRRSVPKDSGAIQQDGVERVVITEMQLSADAGESDPFIEVFAPRDRRTVDLSGFRLYVNGVAVHTFGEGVLALTNSVNPTFSQGADVSDSYSLRPGRGVVVVFPKGGLADFTGFSPSNGTPVVRASIVTNAFGFANLLSPQGRGSVSIAKSVADGPIALQTFLTAFIDPDSATGTNALDTAHNSIASAPQSRGFAFIPHSSVSMAFNGGWGGRPSVTPAGVLLRSPGATADGTPFGLNNASPFAVPDYLTLTEDDVGLFDVLSNDFDSDGNDRPILVDVSAETGAGVGDAASALSHVGAAVAMAPVSDPLRGEWLTYDPRNGAAFQALPAGAEILDTFRYEILDIGSAAVNAITNGTATNTWVTAVQHRLLTGDGVTISGCSVPAYTGTFAVVALDDDTFAIRVPFTTGAGVPGWWEASATRIPSTRSEAVVTVKVIGVNDTPVVGADVVTNVTEIARVRIMARPEKAGLALSLPSDPVPPPAPNPAHLLDNDADVDTDDTWQSLRLVGIMSQVHAISDYSGTPGEAPVTVRAPGHGLATGAAILIANYGGYPTYNGYQTVTVVDEDTFTIPVYFVDDQADKGLWVVLNDDNRYHIVTDVGATVDLVLRADVREDCLIYDAAASAFLKGVAEGENYTNRFYQAVQDSHGAIGIGPVDVVVSGINDTPVAPPDPSGLSVLDPLVSPSNTLENVLASGLELLYTLPAASGAAARCDLQALDLSDTITNTIVLADLWFTDEDTPILIAAADLLANDSDVDRQDVLNAVAVEPFSREGSALTLAGGQITYDPTGAAQLQALAREERVVDTFYVAVSDGMTAGTVTSLVAVVVTGCNDTPVAQPDSIELTEDEFLLFNPMLYPAASPALYDYDLDLNGLWPDDELTILSVSNLITVGQSRVDLAALLARYDATVSERMNQLADWQDDHDSFTYTITDNSFLFAVADEYYVPTNTVGRTLDVLANDRDFTARASTLAIVEVSPTLNGGTVEIASGGSHLVYSSAPDWAGDDYFRYVVQNGAGDRRSARVLVRSVIPPSNGVLSAADDHFAVAYGETAALDVLANDNMLPAGAAGLALAADLVETSQPGQPVLSGGVFHYTATNGLGPLTFTYEVSAGGTSVARAHVVVSVIDRRGTLTVQNDAFSVSAGSASNECEVLGNDALVTGSTSQLRIGALLTPAAHGMAFINESSTSLVYTPDSDFVGVEQLLYLATDGIGGTGTGAVSVAVGKIDTAIDYFTVAASTNPAPVSLDVLANDRIQPCPTGTLTLVSVAPADTAIGSIQVGGAGASLQFIPSNSVGQADFTYVAADATGRSNTGVVTVATVPDGIYANADRFLVRGGGSEYELDVLANDRSYPDVNKTYTIVSIGTGADAPSAGGSVSMVGNRLVYAPLAGFYGQETFTYVMSDSVDTDTARVTLTVCRGDLFANNDRYAVFYELDDGGPTAKGFTLPVVLNDRIQPPLGQVIQITGLGVGTNAPDHAGAVSVGADGVSLVYRPTQAPAPSFVERFTYEISDGTERRASAVVEVQVINRENELVALTQDDAFTVARNSADNALPVLRNDFAQPGTADGWLITGVSSAARGGSAAVSGDSVIYTPADGFVGEDTFTYSVNDGLGGTGDATVRVRVGERPTLPDLFVALSGSASNTFDVIGNDILDGAYAGEYPLADVFGATHGGTVALSDDNQVYYTPDASYAGSYPYGESFVYTAADDAGGVVTGYVQVVVHQTGSDRSTTTVSVHVLGRNDIPVILNVPPNLPITDKQTSAPFTGMTLTEVDEQTLEKVDVSVALDAAVKGVLTNLGGFASLGGGRYAVSNVTAAYATEQIRGLCFVPTENRITVPTSENTRFTVTITDNKSDPVLDTQTVVQVTAINDPPVISGTRAGQTVYAAMPIRLFSSVTIAEVDDLTVQPLDLTVLLSDPTHGSLTNLGSFAMQTNGLYRATGLTAAEATRQLRAMEFVYGAYAVQANNPQLTVFTISVSDRFASPVVDGLTSVWAYNAFEGLLQPTNAVLQISYGYAVDCYSEFAVVGSPYADVNGTDSGSALVYRLVPGTTNTWEVWRQLQPDSVDGNDRFGRSVSIGEDLIAVGASQDEVGGPVVGAVYIFQRDAGGVDNWGLLTRIAPTNLPASSLFGLSVDLDGDLLAVGAPKGTLSGASPAEGCVFVFGRNHGGLNAWGEIARWEPAGQTSLDCGWSVSISGDHLAAGAPGNKSETPAGSPLGAVYYLSRNVGGADAWGLAQKIVQTNITTVADFGYCVSMDGTLLAVGAPKLPDGSNEGQVLLYQKAASSNWWSEVYRVKPAVGPERLFGQSLSVNSGSVFVGAVGREGGSDTGDAFLFRRGPLQTNSWSQVEKFVHPVVTSTQVYAFAVSFKRDSAIVGTVDHSGSAFNPIGKGQAYMYRFKFNNAPVVVSPVPDQYAEWNEPFTYAISDGVFADPDVGDTVAVVPSLPAGGYGLALDGMTVTGTPVSLGPVQVRVDASDASGATALDAFDVRVLVDGILLAPTPRNSWNVLHFGTAVVNPTLEGTVWGGWVNGDGDLLNNDQEYVFGGDPGVSDQACLSIALAADGTVLISYVGRKDDPALVYTLQASATLSPLVWADVQTRVLGLTRVAVDQELERVTLTVEVVGGEPTLFYRLLVTQ